MIQVLGSLTYLLYPYTGDGYQFWSGIGSDIGELAMVQLVIYNVIRSLLADRTF
jgi:hypothetical protein